MNHIQQQDDSTCGVACAAMVAGVPFEVAHSKARQFVHKNGIGSREMGTVLRRLRVRFTRKLFPELCRTVPHIVVVPSLNVTGGFALCRGGSHTGVHGSVRPPAGTTWKTVLSRPPRFERRRGISAQFVHRSDQDRRLQEELKCTTVRDVKCHATATGTLMTPWSKPNATATNDALVRASRKTKTRMNNPL